jgi:xylulokinase
LNDLILAIDLGTSGPKVALVTPQGQVRDCRAGACKLTILPGGGAEQNPDEWWAVIRATLAELLAANPDAAGRIAAIGCTSQWSGTVAVGEDGRPLMNALIWMDARGAPYVAQITDGPIKLQGYSLRRLITWLRLTGGLPAHSGKDSIAHILFIKHQ